MGEVDEIDLGFLKVWNFDRQKTKYIADPALLTKVEKILATHVTQHSNVKGIGIVQIADNDFQPLSDKEVELVQQARAILFLSIVSANNTKIQDGNSGHSMMTSENFDATYQNFSLDDDYISERTGAIIPFMKAGFTLQKVRFQMPSFVPTPSRYDIDRSMFAGLLQLRVKKPKVFRRVVESTHIFIEGYYNASNFSDKNRILTFMSAFEMFFALPDDNKQRMHFKSKIGEIANFDGERTYTNFHKGRSKPNSKEAITKKVLWAEKFYRLRNRIIHGEKITYDDFLFEKKQPHVQIALIFFIQSIKRQLERSLKQFSCDYEIRWESYIDRITHEKPTKTTLFVYSYSRRKLFEKLRKLSK